MKRLLGILLLMAVISSGSNHLMAQWIQTNGPEGGPVNCFAVSGTNLFAGIQESGVWQRPLSEMPTSVEIVSSERSLTFCLEQNYPNPFNPTTTIQFRVRSSEWRAKAPIHTTLNIYNILGQKVRTVVDQYLKAGHKAVEWDGKDDWGKEVSSGICLYRLQTEDFAEARKILLIR